MRSVFLAISVFLLAFAAVPTGFGQGGTGNKTGGAKLAVDNAVAGAGPGVIITAPTMGTPPSSTFDANYIISDVSGRGILSYQMDLQYNSSVIQFNSCSTVSTISSVGSLLCNNSAPGLIELVWTSVAVLNNDGNGAPSILFKVNFTALGPVTSFSNLTFTDVQINEFAVPATVNSGRVTIGAGTAADVIVVGRVLDSTGRGVSKARLRMAGGDGIPRYALTNGFGYYRFTGVDPAETYTIYVESKKFTFSPRTISPSEDIFDLDFIAGQ